MLFLKNIHWRYKNLTIAFLGILLAIGLTRIHGFHTFLAHLGTLGYIGAFVCGILFVSTFTMATSVVILFTLAEYLSPVEIGLIAGLGAVVGDLIIFHLIRDDLESELVDIYERVDTKSHLRNLLHSKYFNWMLPVIGATIIASPLPDELGVSLMGISRMNPIRFAIVSYILNSIGIFLVVSSSFFFAPR